MELTVANSVCMFVSVVVEAIVFRCLVIGIFMVETIVVRRSLVSECVNDVRSQGEVFMLP